MPDNTFNFQDFSRRLFLGGARNTLPQGAVRRCVGCAPEPEPILKSRWGSTLRFSVPNVISMGCFFDAHYLYDGRNLWYAQLQNPKASIIDTGYNGSRVTMVKAPPAFGIPNYLFMIGGGRNVKITPDNTVQNWGIDKPVNQMTASLVAQDQTLIDNFDISSGNWTAVHCSLADTSIPGSFGFGSLQVTPDGTGIAPWSITRNFGGALNLATYTNGDISLETDYITFWLNAVSPANSIWLNLQFDVDPVNPDFAHNYYQCVIQIVPATSNLNASSAAIILDALPNQWIQVAIAKSQFTRMGTDLNLDWSAVQKVRFTGGNELLPAPVPALYLDNFYQFGGVGLGTGPAAIQNGSELQYLVTFGNNITGNDSNPSDHITVIADVKTQAVQLSNIPLSTDPQVGNRKLWRTSEGGSLFFFLDIIPDNTTTGYIDMVSSLAGQPIATTPWTANVTVPLHQYIDSGTGYYMQCTTAGTSGANAPNWNLPTTAWAGLAAFSVGDIVLPLHPNHQAFKVVQAGNTGPATPAWGSASTIGDRITDGSVIWENIGTLTTQDNTVVWTTVGQNAQQALGTDQVQYDNNLFPSTCLDAVYFQGSMFVGHDTNPGMQNNLYVSTPGKCEGYANIVRVGTEDDAMQKMVVWDERLWVFTSRYVYPLNGTTPNLAVGEKILGAEGTSWPYTVVPTVFGIVYRAVSGVRLFNNAANQLLGYEAIAPIERGQVVENVHPFNATIAGLMKDEVVFSDGAVSFALSGPGDNATWRMLGLGLNAIIYHDEIQVTHGAVAEAVYDLEVPNTYTDNGKPIPVEWQTPSVMSDATQLAMTKRIWLDLDPGGQILLPTLLVDNQDISLPLITGLGRQTIPIPWQTSGRVVGLRLTGNVIQRVTLYGCWAESRNGH
jgi:hypothetical protein